MADIEITPAQEEAYFKSGGETLPPAIVEAAKIEAEAPPEEAPVEAAPKAEAQKPAEPEKPKAGEVSVTTEDGKTVPLAELMEERKSRQFYQQTVSAQQQQLNDMIKLVQNKVSPQEQETAPDPNADPFGYITWGLNNVQKTTAEINQWRQEQAQAQQQATQQQQFDNWTASQAHAFRESNPDYQDAYKFAIDARDSDLKAIGYADPAARQQAIQNDLRMIAWNAAQTNQNPAALVYAYAKERGFKAEIVAEAKAKPDLDDKVKTIRKGQEQSSMSRTSGGAPTEVNNLTDLLGAADDMDDDAFSKAFDKIAPRMKGKFA